MGVLPALDDGAGLLVADGEDAGPGAGEEPGRSASAGAEAECNEAVGERELVEQRVVVCVEDGGSARVAEQHLDGGEGESVAERLEERCDGGEGALDGRVVGAAVGEREEVAGGVAEAEQPLAVEAGGEAGADAGASAAGGDDGLDAVGREVEAGEAGEDLDDGEAEEVVLGCLVDVEQRAAGAGGGVAAGRGDAVGRGALHGDHLTLGAPGVAMLGDGDPLAGDAAADEEGLAGGLFAGEALVA